jgi:hypothetical protein
LTCGVFYPAEGEGDGAHWGQFRSFVLGIVLGALSAPIWVGAPAYASHNFNKHFHSRPIPTWGGPSGTPYSDTYLYGRLNDASENPSPPGSYTESWSGVTDMDFDYRGSLTPDHHYSGQVTYVGALGGDGCHRDPLTNLDLDPSTCIPGGAIASTVTGGVADGTHIQLQVWHMYIDKTEYWYYGQGNPGCNVSCQLDLWSDVLHELGHLCCGHLSGETYCGDNVEIQVMCPSLSPLQINRSPKTHDILSANYAY